MLVGLKKKFIKITCFCYCYTRIIPLVSLVTSLKNPPSSRTFLCKFEETSKIYIFSVIPLFLCDMSVSTLTYVSYGKNVVS